MLRQKKERPGKLCASRTISIAASSASAWDMAVARPSEVLGQTGALFAASKVSSFTRDSAAYFEEFHSRPLQKQHRMM